MLHFSSKVVESFVKSRENFSSGALYKPTSWIVDLAFKKITAVCSKAVKFACDSYWTRKTSV